MKKISILFGAIALVVAGCNKTDTGGTGTTSDTGTGTGSSWSRDTNNMRSSPGASQDTNSASSSSQTINK